MDFSHIKRGLAFLIDDNCKWNSCNDGGGWWHSGLTENASEFRLFAERVDL